VTKRVYGNKRIKKSQPASANVDASPEDESSAQARPVKPAEKGAPADAPLQPEPLSKKERKRRAKEIVEDEISCRMGILQRIWRVFGFVLMMGLNTGIVGGDLLGGSSYVRLSWQRETISLLLLAGINALILFPILFEVWLVKADKEGIELRSMFWRTVKKWDQVTDFKNPNYLKLAMLRTGRGLFFINRRLPNYPILEQLILRYMRVAKTK
jgi:hypothetical protein